MPEQAVGPVQNYQEGEADFGFEFTSPGGRRRFSTRIAAERARQTEIDRQRSLQEPAAPPRDEGASTGLRGEEFRTTQQQRAEAELAAQLGRDRLSEITPPEAPETVKMELAPLTTAADEFMTTTDKLLGATPKAALTEAAAAREVTEAPTLAAPRGTEARVVGQEEEMAAATLAAPTRIIDPTKIEGAVSAESLATAQTEELDERATLTFQLDQLFKGFKPGEIPPAWATPLIRRSAARSLASGIGASSMAAAATVQAIIEAGIPLAREDAQRYATLQIQNLSNKQQTALANAAVYAAMDQTNVGVRLQAQIQNAQNFLAIDTANLTNRQQGEVLNQQAHNQFLLSDQAAENAMEQLNVQTESQTDQFFSQLGATIRTANADRATAVEQFNAGQANTIEVFNAKQKDLRERFNAEQATDIQASNVGHNRAVTRQITQNQMLVNEFNAREINSMNIREYQQLYLNYRDTATRIYATAESNEGRATQLAIAELQASAARSAGKTSIVPALITGAATVAAAF
jgi:hypothetical protein